MAIRFSLDDDDLRALCRFLLASRSLGKLLLACLLVALGGGVLGGMLGLSISPFFPGSLVRYTLWGVLLGAVGLSALVASLGYRYWQLATPSGIRHFLASPTARMMRGEQQVRIDADGITNAGTTGAVIIPWSRVQAFSQTDKHLFVLTHANTSVLIPTRAFPDAAQLREFVETIERHLGKARTDRERAIGDAARPPSVEGFPDARGVEPPGVRLWDLEFRLTKEDVIHALNYDYQRRPSKHPSTRQRVFLFLVILLSLLVGFFLSGRSWQGPILPRWPEDAWALGGIAFTLLYVCVAVLFRPRLEPNAEAAAGSLLRQNPKILGPVKLTITDKGYSRVWDGGGEMRPWSVIRAVEVAPDIVLLYTNETNFIMVPKHPFVSEQEFREFAETVRRAHQSAKGS